jgi:mitogen-activated protein kinase organizer 1
MDKANGQLLRAYKSPDYKNTDYRIRSRVSTRDEYVLSGSEDGRVVVWDFMDGKVLGEFWHNKAAEEALVEVKGERERKKHVVSAVAWCRTRNEWASAGGDGNVVVWGQ